MEKAEKYRQLYLKHLEKGGNKNTIKWYYYKWLKIKEGR